MSLARAARVALLISALAAGSCGAIATASRASVNIDVESADPAGSGSQELVLRSAGTDTNIVFVRYEEPRYVVTSAGSPLTAGPGCMLTDLNVATCMGTIASARIRGGDAADVIDLTGVPIPVDGAGEAGDDALSGGDVRNTLLGGEGVDQLRGGAERDDLVGGSDDDWILGLGNSDALSGNSGDDILEAGSGERDVLLGGSGRDLAKGGSGSDVMQGGAGDDTLFGGAGADTLAPGTGTDAVIGFRAADHLDCPTAVDGGQLRATSCAELEPGRPPDAWPPLEGTSVPAQASRDRSYAVPVTAGNATAVQVHVPAKRSKTVRRCLRTYSQRNHRGALNPFRIKFRSKYWPTVKRPRPNPSAMSARLTRRKPCRR